MPKTMFEFFIGQKDQGTKHHWGEKSWWQNVLGTIRPGTSDETSWQRKVKETNV